MRPSAKQPDHVAIAASYIENNGLQPLRKHCLFKAKVPEMTEEKRLAFLDGVFSALFTTKKTI
ncbi:MAG: hypothetical protein COB66_09025 [Coxiella sp. (in: Bacteria)]|nr:MAG: hypothetical protein COB66_09025 [Coxiella sp. (in: g-proteobacteria)]